MHAWVCVVHQILTPVRVQLSKVCDMCVIDHNVLLDRTTTWYWTIKDAKCDPTYYTPSSSRFSFLNYSVLSHQNVEMWKRWGCAVSMHVSSSTSTRAVSNVLSIASHALLFSLVHCANKRIHISIANHTSPFPLLLSFSSTSTTMGDLWW